MDEEKHGCLDTPKVKPTLMILLVLEKGSDLGPRGGSGYPDTSELTASLPLLGPLPSVVW